MSQRPFFLPRSSSPPVSFNLSQRGDTRSFELFGCAAPIASPSLRPARVDSRARGWGGANQRVCPSNFMGLDAELVRLLLEARQAGVSFRRTLTLGRQHYFVGHRETRALLARHGIDPDQHPDLFTPRLDREPRFADAFWRALGSDAPQSLDASDYEGATRVHDLNRAVPAEWAGQYDAVCDAGTLEHVYAFPVAFRSCLEMVRVGGHLLLFTTANNYCGHGFYQFSPELFFRALSESNGYRVERMVAVEYAPRIRRYAVTDPEALHRRVSPINRHPVLLFVQARRLRDVPLFANPPLQSDYVVQWQDRPPAARPGQPSWSERVKLGIAEHAPGLARFLDGWRYSGWNRRYSFRDSQAFRRLP